MRKKIKKILQTWKPFFSFQLYVAKIQCGNQGHLVGSLIINGVNIRHPKQGAVLDEVRSRSVTGRVPQTAAADLHALSTQLADVHQDNNLVSWNQQVLYAGSDHLSGGRSVSTGASTVPPCRVFETRLPRTAFLSFFVTTLLHTSPLGGNW